MERFDLIVIGSGMGGSITAWIGARLGLRVLMLERSRHPRFTIGESSTPISNLLLGTLAERYGLRGLDSLCNWGTWQSKHPELRAGLKRGFTFLQHRPGLAFAGRADRADQLAVAASPRDDIADVHWLRADVDAWLVDQAIAAGVTYRDLAEVGEVSFADGIARVAVGGSTVEGRYVVDAAGPRGVLAGQQDIQDVGFEVLPHRCTLFGHFSGVNRVADLHPEAFDGAPYPIDDAALHHLLPGAWVWVLHFGHGVTSAGVTATEEVATELGLASGEGGWRRLLQRFPTLQAQFAGARIVEPLRYWPTLSYRLERGSGPGFWLLPFTSTFVDPILSTGFATTLTGIERFARALEGGVGPDLDERVRGICALGFAEADALALLASALYASFEDMEVFEALTMLYFAGITFSETLARLGRPTSMFMHLDHPEFGPAVARCCHAALTRPTGAARAALLRDLRSTIEPLDVAGLCRADRSRWFPVDLDDLYAGAHRLPTGRDEITKMLRAYGLT